MKQRHIFESVTGILVCLSALLAVCIVSTSFAENEIPHGPGFASKEADFMDFYLNTVEHLKIGTGEQPMDQNPNRSFDLPAGLQPQNSPEATDSFPSASITFPSWDETTLSLGGVITFVASVTGGNSPLTYLWDFDGGAENSTLLNPGSIGFEDPGTFTVTFTVADADGDQDSDSMVVSVVREERVDKKPEDVDKKPPAEITSPTEDVTITAGQSVQFTANQGGEWDFQGEVVFYTGTFSLPGRVQFVEPGIHNVTFTVWYTDNASDSDTVRITVNPVSVDTKPVIRMISPESDVTIVEERSIMFYSLVHGGNPPFEYEWNFDGAAEGYFEHFSFEYPPRPIAFDQPGIYNVTFTVTDADGDTDRVLRVITFKPSHDSSGSGCFITVVSP